MLNKILKYFVPTVSVFKAVIIHFTWVTDPFENPVNNKEDTSSLKNICVRLHRGTIWPKILGDSQLSPTGYLWT